jgi:hypothetical protein
MMYSKRWRAKFGKKSRQKKSGILLYMRGDTGCRHIDVYHSIQVEHENLNLGQTDTALDSGNIKCESN